MPKEVYENLDYVLATLELPDPCPVKIVIDGNYVRFYVGQRDYQWDRKTQQFVGGGCGCSGQGEDTCSR